MDGWKDAGEASLLSRGFGGCAKICEGVRAH